MERKQKTDLGTRDYHSPLRAAQVAHTRDLILDALTALLSEHPSDEISPNDIASRADVAERTVYRHFPDRSSLHDGLAQRALDVGGPDIDDVDTLDDVVDIVPEVYATFDQHEALTRAAVLLSADPRRMAADSKRRSQKWSAATDRTFPDLDQSQRLGLTAMTRIFGSAQTWLRLREEFGMDADQSGALAAWAMQAMLNDTRRGNPPPSR